MAESVEGMQYASGAVTLGLLLHELESQRRQPLEVMRTVRARSRTDRYRRRAEHLMMLKGIGLVSAMVLLTKLVDIKRFRSLDRLPSTRVRLHIHMLLMIRLAAARPSADERLVMWSPAPRHEKPHTYLRD